SSRRRHTRFDCDWSSDVCSSDLCVLPAQGALADLLGNAATVGVDVSKVTGKINRNLVGVDWKLGTADGVNSLHPNIARADIAFRSEERRVGKGGRLRWSR